MAACLIEDNIRTFPRIYLTSLAMEDDKSPSQTIESSSCSLSHRRKRRLSLTEINQESIESISKNSCSSPTASDVKSLKRPKSLLLSTQPIDHSLTRLRTCLSDSSAPTHLQDDYSLSPSNFQSLPEIPSPSMKRFRPQTLMLNPVAVKSSAIRLINPTELIDKWEKNISMMIFDCGFSLRYSENRIRNAVLLRVANKISRKRFKSQLIQGSSINMKQLSECSDVILYDDYNHDQSSSSSTDSIVEHLSSGLKCACEELQQLEKNLSIFILSCSFKEFSNLHPDMCESPPILSSPSMNHSNSNSEDQLPMTHIIDGLFIGSESNAKNLQELTAEDIRCIVNVTSHVPLYHEDLFRYCHLPADDSQKQNLLEYFDQAYRFIHQAIERNEKVLVHCVAGISRSPAIVIGFLMKHAAMTMNEAYELVKRKRTIVSPNLNFMGQLLQYEKHLKQSK